MRRLELEQARQRELARPIVRRVYVAGPFSGDIEANCNRAQRAAIEVAQRGHFVHCPHAATRFMHGMFNYEWFMALDLDIIDKWADTLLYLGPSPGADRELEHACSLGKLLVSRPDELIRLTP